MWRSLQDNLRPVGAVMIGVSLSLLAVWIAAVLVVEILSPGSTSDTASWSDDWKWAAGALAVALAPGAGGLALFAVYDVTSD